MNPLRSLFLGAIVACSSISAFSAPILVGEWASPNSGDASEKAAARAAIISYNVLNNPDLPQLFDTAGIPLAGWIEFVAKTNVSNGPNTFAWTAPASYTNYYVISKYGQGQANFDSALHYLGAGDVLSYNPGGSGPPNGLSHYWIWATGPTGGPVPRVPDSGSTLALLGLGLALMGFARRSNR